MDIHTLRAQCSALNPEVLQQLIRETGEKECNQLMESYMSKLQSFQNQTKLQSFKGSGEQLGLAPQAYSRLDVEFQDEWMDKTLEDLEDFRKHSLEAMHYDQDSDHSSSNRSLLNSQTRAATQSRHQCGLL